MNHHKFRYFDWVDYSVFGLLLTGSVCIGIYFGFLSKRKNTKLEYLLGSREIGLIPLTASLLATQLTGVTLIGFVAEIYKSGCQLWLMIAADLISAPIIAYWFVPVFYNMDKTSMYEYLNKRFNASVRTLGSGFFILKILLTAPVMIYSSCLALAEVTGISIKIIIPVTCFVCIFYTTIGGMKAVVWTDTLQFLVIATSIVFIAILGTVEVGGLQKIGKVVTKGERMEFFNMSMDPTERHTFWNVVFGFAITRFSHRITDQGNMQRYFASSSLKRAQITVMALYIGLFVCMNVILYTGMIVYTAFADCDPVTAGVLRKADQILPYFIMTVTGQIPALPGIFLSAVFSASLSTLSTGLNSMSGVIVDDFLTPLFKNPISEERAPFYMKIATVVLGSIITVLAFGVEYLSGIVQGGHSLTASVQGANLGIILLGLFVPWANSHGALAGATSAMGLVSFMAYGQQMAIRNKSIVNPAKPVSIEGCDNSTLSLYFNRTAHLQTVSHVLPSETEPPFVMFRISYALFSMIGLATAMTVGMLVSWVTGFNNPADMDPQLFSPAIHRFLPEASARRRNAGGSENNLDAEQNLALMPKGCTAGNSVPIF